MVLIGMPGLEKQLARYAQLYSRIGFVHEFKALSREEVRQLLQERWWPALAPMPDGGIADEESITAIIRITGGNFRLLHRLLTQIGRVLEINKLEKTGFEETKYSEYRELFSWFAAPGLALVLLVGVLMETRFRSLP